MEKLYYVYSHWVLGMETPFYVGMATKDKFGFIYQRAYRNCFGMKKETDWRQFAREVRYNVIIEKEFSDIVDAINFEVKLIKKYGRVDMGTGTLLNKTDGGIGVKNTSKETQEKRIKSIRSKFNSEYLKNSHQPYSIPTFKYSLTGTFLQEYRSVSEAARLNNSLPSDICLAIKNKKNTVAGFQWRTYKNTNGIGSPPPAKRRYKPINQIDFNTNQTIKTWNSIIEASNGLGISRNGIGNVLIGRSKTAGGYIWTYYNVNNENPSGALKLGLVESRLNK